MSLASRLIQHLRADAPASAAVEDPRPWLANEASPTIDVGPSPLDRDDPLADLRREALEEARVVGLAELRAAALMVAEGEATRITLVGFSSWPGLLTEIERLSSELDLTIIPAVVRPGGRVDLVVTPPDSQP